jgi:hypothetical protein
MADSQVRLQESERRLIGWRLVGTDLWCPAWMGQPPESMGKWEPVYRVMPEERHG